MAKIYKRNCNHCGIPYIGDGVSYCSTECCRAARRAKPEPEFKVCSLCGATLPIGDFPAKRNGRAIHSCSACTKAYLKGWRSRNPDYTKTHNDKYRRDNPERIRQNSAKYGADNRALLRSKNREWYRKNRQYAIDQAARWKRDNPERFSMHMRKMDAKRRGAEGTFSATDILRLLSEQDGKCAACAVDIADHYEIDHVIPLSRGGSNWPSNLQLLCMACNRNKAAKMPIQWLLENFTAGA